MVWGTGGWLGAGEGSPLWGSCGALGVLDPLLCLFECSSVRSCLSWAPGTLRQRDTFSVSES